MDGLIEFLSELTLTQVLIGLFALIVFGLLLPLSSGKRSALLVALIILGVLTFIGGSTHYLIGLTQ